MTKIINIKPDTQEAREEVFLAVANEIDGPPPIGYQLPLNGRIDLRLIPDPKRSTVLVSFNGEDLYAPYLDIFERAVATTRSGVKHTIGEDL